MSEANREKATVPLPSKSQSHHLDPSIESSARIEDVHFRPSDIDIPLLVQECLHESEYASAKRDTEKEATPEVGFWKGIAQFILEPLGLWVHMRGLDTSNAVANGFPRVTAFISSDPDHLTSIYKRFDTLNIRNLLFLEARVAALEEVQRKLDEQNVLMLKRTRGQNFALQTTGQSFEYFAYLSLCPVGRDHPIDIDNRPFGWKREPHSPKELGIPNLALALWNHERHWDKKEWERRMGLSTLTSSEMPDHYFQDRWELTIAIKEALKEYQEAVVLQDQMLRLSRPTKGTSKALRAFMKEKLDRDGDLLRPDQFRGATKDILNDLEDLVSLHPPGDDDFGTKIVASVFGQLLRRHNSPNPEFDDVSEKAVGRVTTIWTFLAAVGFLMGAVWFIWRIGLEETGLETKFTRKLAVMTGFTGLFGAWVGVFTVARRSEIFGATAAYAAVLIVFIGTDPGAAVPG